MNRRVDEILDLARGEAGILKVNVEPMDPLIPIQKVVDFMEPLVQQNALSLALDLPERLPVVLADKERVQQVLFNLINNAVKYSNRGSRITVAAREEGDDLVVEVRDEGRGMKEEECGNLFQPTYRIDGQKNLSGIGLGLALSKKLLELQNGKIWVKSQIGEGSSFFFSLPLMEKNSGKDSTMEGDGNENSDNRG